MNNPVGKNKQKFLVDKQSLLLVQRSFTMPCKGVHQTPALQGCDLSCPGPSISSPWGCCCQKTATRSCQSRHLSLPGMAPREEKQSALLRSPPLLGRQEIGQLGRAALLHCCKVMLRPGPCLMFGYICCVSARNILSQIFWMQMFRQWTINHIIGKCFFSGFFFFFYVAAN